MYLMSRMHLGPVEHIWDQYTTSTPTCLRSVKIIDQGITPLIRLMDGLAAKDACLCVQMHGNGPKYTQQHLFGI